MGVIQLCTCKLTPVARVISERKDKITPYDSAVIFPAPLPLLEGVILPHLEKLKLHNQKV